MLNTLNTTLSLFTKYMQTYLNGLNAMIFKTLLWNRFLSLYLSMQVAQKSQIFDEYGMTGISSFGISAMKYYCWTHLQNEIAICNLGENIRGNCTIVSNRYYVNATVELFIEIKTETRKTRNRTCEDTFALFTTFESNKLNKTRTDEIAKVPNNKCLHELGTFIETTDTFSFVKYREYDYFMVGFDGTSYCGKVTSFSMYYHICPESIELVEFVRQAAPIKSLSPKILVGKCTTSAVERSSPLTMKCYFNGSFEVFGSCECRPGFTNVNMKCQGWYYF